MKHVLILGCGRSGTSIFGELFEHLSTHKYLSEPPFSKLIDWDYDKLLAVKVPKEDAAFPPEEGLSFPLNTLLEHFEKPYQLYWQVRNPLDTICSLKVGISKNWGHHPKPPDWQDWLEKPLVVQCAHHWNYINTVGFKKVQSLVKICHFEDMLENPLSFAERICTDIVVDIVKNSNELKAWSQRVQDTNNKNFIEADTSKAYSTNDHKVKVGRWRENMTEQELEMVKPIVKDTALSFGYELP